MVYALLAAQSARAQMTIFGSPCVYTPYGASEGSTFTMIVRETMALADTPGKKDAIPIIAQVPNARFMKSDIPNPKKNDKITDADGVNWYIIECETRQSGVYFAKLSKNPTGVSNAKRSSGV